MVEARLFSQCRNGVEAASSIPSGCEAGRPWGRERRFLSLHRAAGRVGRGSLWFVCQTKVVDSLFLSLLRLPLFSHHQDELWLTKTYLPGFIYIYVYMVLPGEGNGTPLQYLLLGISHGRRSLVGCNPWGR